METFKWKIKIRWDFGQQRVEAWDNEKQKFIPEINYIEPCFIATRDEARKILKHLKSHTRNYKWIKLYNFIS